MGIIKAVVGAVGGGLADQWLEVIEADRMDETTLITTGVQISSKRGSNKKASVNNISNGSTIRVYPDQMMILMDGGKVVDYTAEPGDYKVDLSSSPSMFNGQFGDAVKETFERVKYGGEPSHSQQAYFVNLGEIKGAKFGTPGPVSYYDAIYDADLFLRAHGSYSVKITDPLKFCTGVKIGNVGRIDVNNMNEMYGDEFLTAFQSALGQLAADGVKISFAMSQKQRELAKYMSTALDDEWVQGRGIEIASVAIKAITYTPESMELINMRSRGAMLKDAAIREGYVQGQIAEGIKSAGSNSAGAAQAFMGMGMGMNSAGGFMNTASQNNMAQMQQQQQMAQQQQAAVQQQQMSADSWKCSCGKVNTGKFCADCGSKKPEAPSGWTCSCGKSGNTGKFCSECGSPMPQNDTWVCSCSKENTGKFCAECGTPRP